MDQCFNGWKNGRNLLKINCQFIGVIWSFPKFWIIWKHCHFYLFRRRPVYQSLSITPEIKLESSSPSIKTEPGLVPEPEEQKSLYFLQQNSSVLPKQEPDSEKTATGTDTLIHKQASTETSSALSENNTNLNIETLKTGHEESDSRLENLENLEEQANSLENLKNSEDTVDTSEAHIPEDLENGVKKEEDCKPEFVFKCPFNPCPAFTIEEVSDYHQNLIRINLETH